MKFLVIDCEDKDAWRVGETFGDMFTKFWKREGDSWEIAEIAKGDSVPSNPEDFQGIMITGSHYDVRDGPTLSWFEPLCQLIRSSAERGSPQVYGSCYGCQIIAHALGGAVDKNPSDRYVFKSENIVPCDDAKALSPLISSLTPFNALECHLDCVIALPPGATLLANSTSTANELYVCGKNHNLVGFQGHPEFDKDMVLNLISPVAVDMGLFENKDDEQASMKSVESFDPRKCEPIVQFIDSFLHQK